MRGLAWLVAKRQEGSVQPGPCCPIPALPFWEAFRVWLSVCSADSALSSCWSQGLPAGPCPLGSWRGRQTNAEWREQSVAGRHRVQGHGATPDQRGGIRRASWRKCRLRWALQVSRGWWGGRPRRRG